MLLFLSFLLPWQILTGKAGRLGKVGVGAVEVLLIYHGRWEQAAGEAAINMHGVQLCVYVPVHYLLRVTGQVVTTITPNFR